MSDFKIETNIELPPSARMGSIYPFKDMQIGDSFFVEGDKKKAGNVRGCMQWAKQALSFNFVSRFRGEKQNGGTVVGVRVWRIE